MKMLLKITKELLTWSSAFSTNDGKPNEP